MRGSIEIADAFRRRGSVELTTLWSACVALFTHFIELAEPALRRGHTNEKALAAKESELRSARLEADDAGRTLAEVRAPLRHAKPHHPGRAPPASRGWHRNSSARARRVAAARNARHGPPPAAAPC